jgi:hypothetical protein
MTGPVFTDGACQADRFFRDRFVVTVDISASHFIHYFAGAIIVLPIEQGMGNGKG